MRCLPLNDEIDFYEYNPFFGFEASQYIPNNSLFMHVGALRQLHIGMSEVDNLRESRLQLGEY